MSISFHKIQHFSIELPRFKYPQFLDRSDTAHCNYLSCKITLFDGRENIVTLRDNTIRTLITNISEYRITNPLGYRYFGSTSTIPVSELNEIISKIFEEIG